MTTQIQNRQVHWTERDNTQTKGRQQKQKHKDYTGYPSEPMARTRSITGLVQCVYVKLCNGRVGGWGLLWQGSLDFIRCLSMVPTMAVSGFCSTSYFPNVSFSCCFVDASLVHLLRLQFWISCHDLWNFLSVDVLSDAVQFSSVDLLALFSVECLSTCASVKAG